MAVQYDDIYYEMSLFILGCTIYFGVTNHTIYSKSIPPAQFVPHMSAQEYTTLY